MKKSKKPTINPDNILKDVEKISEFIEAFEKLDLSNINLKELEKKAKKIEEELTKKYKDILPETYGDDLDTEE